MMTDIVERLRDPRVYIPGEEMLQEAADEITALRAELERLKVEAAAQYADGAHDGSDRAQDLWAGEITALRAEIERLRAALEEVRVLVFGANRSEARYPLARAAIRALIKHD